MKKQKLFTPAEAAAWLKLSLPTVMQYARCDPPRLRRHEESWEQWRRLRFTLEELERSRAELQKRGPKPGKPQKRRTTKGTIDGRAD